MFSGGGGRLDTSSAFTYEIGGGRQQTVEITTTTAVKKNEGPA